MRNRGKRNKNGTKPSGLPTLSTTEIKQQVEDLVGPALAAGGMELILVESAPGAGGIGLRLFVDKPGGVTVADCATVSRHVRDVLDAVMDTETISRLEVSSPGADRPLTRERHFNQFLGKRAKIRTDRPINGRKKFFGVLKGAAEGIVTITMDETTIAIPREAISSARLHNGYGEDPC